MGFISCIGISVEHADVGTKSAEQTLENHAAHNDLKINLENSGANLSTISGHLESPSKLNQAILSSYEKDMNFTSQKSCKISGLDQHALFEAPQSNQEVSSYKPASSEILAQKGRCGTWNQTKPKSEEEDIQVTSQPDFDFAELDLPALIGKPRSYQRELSAKHSFFGILPHKRISETLNHINPSFKEGVMNFSNKCNLHLPYLEAHEIGRTQQCNWRPEDYLAHLEASKKMKRCMLGQWIIGIHYISIIHEDFPYEGHMTLMAFILRQLLPKLFGSIKKISDVPKDVPRQLTYPSKPIKYKGDPTCLVWSPKSPTTC